MTIKGNFQVGSTSFAHWFNTSFEVNHNDKFPYPVVESNFNKLMDMLPQFTGKTEITIQEFVGHFCIMYNETGGTFKPIREMGYARYMFGTNNGLKLSYNQAPNLLAGNQLKSWGLINDPNDVALWNGQVFPIGAPQPVITASFKCDYYRFRGWGLNQLTWRNAYMAHIQPFLPKPIDDYGYEEFETLLSETNYDLACKAYHSFAQSSPTSVQAMINGNYVPYGNLISGGWAQYVNGTYVPRCQSLYNALTANVIA